MPAGALTDQAARVDRAARPASSSPPATSTPTSALPAAGAVEPGQLLAVMGTSTCHVMSADVLADVPGMCGVVDGGIIAGKYGYEAGQSGVGDIFAWWVEQRRPPAISRRGG